MIQTPFEILSAVSKNPELKLYPEELDAIMPSWKTVYDKRIAPRLGENADIYQFVTVMIGISAIKYNVYQSKKPKNEHVEENIKEAKIENSIVMPSMTGSA